MVSGCRPNNAHRPAESLAWRHNAGRPRPLWFVQLELCCTDNESLVWLVVFFDSQSYRYSHVNYGMFWNHQSWWRNSTYVTCSMSAAVTFRGGICTRRKHCLLFSLSIPQLTLVLVERKRWFRELKHDSSPLHFVWQSVISHYPRRRRVAAAPWSCTYL